MENDTRPLSRRGVLTALAAVAAGVASPAFGRSGAPSSSLRPAPRPAALPAARAGAAMQPTPEVLISDAKLGGQVGFIVADAQTGAVLEEAGATDLLPPASTAKTLTTLYALETLGQDFRFTTQLVATGPIAGGVLQGDLVLLGGGDPTLDTDDLGDLAAQMKAAGVARVAGRFIVSTGALPHVQVIDPSQPPQVGYDPGLSGINLNFNRFYFGWEKKGTGYSVTLDARGRRYNAPVSVAQMRVIDRPEPPYTYDSGDGIESWSVAEWTLGKGGGRWLPVRDPGRYAGDVFRGLAAAQGVALPEAVVTEAAVAGTVIARHDSDVLREVLRGMLKYSTNLTAEVAGLTASLKQGGPVTTLAASAKRMTDWAKARFGVDMHLIDHSGLGIDNRASPADFVRLLAASGADSLRGILKPIRMLDDRGRLIKDSRTSVQGKTGTLNFVSNLVGFETTPKGRELIFAILTGDVARSAAVPLEERERPRGVRSWTGRAHRLQQDLMRRWAAVYDAAG